jgi:hypothetical protein
MTGNQRRPALASALGNFRGVVASRACPFLAGSAEESDVLRSVLETRAADVISRSSAYHPDVEQ